MLGDVIIAEPGAMIGFAGPRVIEQTVRQTLPEGFQKSEFLLEKGHIDMIVHRAEMRDRICTLVRLFGAADLSVVPIEKPADYEGGTPVEAQDVISNDAEPQNDTDVEVIAAAAAVAAEGIDAEDAKPAQTAEPKKAEKKSKTSESEELTGLGVPSFT